MAAAAAGDAAAAAAAEAAAASSICLSPLEKHENMSSSDRFLLQPNGENKHINQMEFGKAVQVRVAAISLELWSLVKGQEGKSNQTFTMGWTLIERSKPAKPRLVGVNSDHNVKEIVI